MLEQQNSVPSHEVNSMISLWQFVVSQHQGQHVFILLELHVVTVVSLQQPPWLVVRAVNHQKIGTLLPFLKQSLILPERFAISEGLQFVSSVFCSSVQRMLPNTLHELWIYTYHCFFFLFCFFIADLKLYERVDLVFQPRQ